MNSIDHIGSMFLRQVLRRMKQFGLNQSALAERMNVSRPYISKVLKSDVNISFATEYPLVADHRAAAARVVQNWRGHCRWISSRSCGQGIEVEVLNLSQ